MTLTAWRKATFVEREFKVPITEVKVYCARAQSKHLRTEITRVEKGRQQCTVLAPHCELLLKLNKRSVIKAFVKKCARGREGHRCYYRCYRNHWGQNQSWTIYVIGKSTQYLIISSQRLKVCIAMQWCVCFIFPLPSKDWALFCDLTIGHHWFPWALHIFFFLQRMFLIRPDI